MNKFNLLFLFMFLMMFTTSCEIVEGIFQIGFWAGIIVVVLIIAVIVWLIRKFR